MNRLTAKMTKLGLTAAFAAVLFSGSLAAQPVQPHCWWQDGGMRCGVPEMRGDRHEQREERRREEERRHEEWCRYHPHECR